MAPKDTSLQIRKLKARARPVAHHTQHMQILTIDVSQVLFSQSSISSVFDNQIPLLQCVSNLLQGRYEADEEWMTLDVYRSPQTPADVYISQNNRRLFCFKLLRFAQSHIRVRVSTHGKVKQNVEKCTRIRSIEFEAATFDVPCQCIWLRHKVDGSAPTHKSQLELRERPIFSVAPFSTLANLFPTEMQLAHKICFEGNTARILAMRYQGEDASDAQCCTLFKPCITQLEAYREHRMELWSTWAEMVRKVL